MVVRILSPPRPLLATSGRDVGLITDDGIDLLGFTLSVELQRTMQIPVVRQGQGVHAVFFGALDEFGNRAGAVEKAVVTVAMKMDKGARRGRLHK